MVSYQLESGAEVTPRFTCGMKTVAIWISRTQFVSLFFRFLNLLFNVLNGKTKLRHDYVFRSLVFHNKMLFEEESKQSEPDVEFITRFVFEIDIVAMASTSRTQVLFVNILKERFKSFYWLYSKNQ